jgi:hypothetical protein
MKNDTAVSLLVASLVIALVCVPVMADIAPPQVCRTDSTNIVTTCIIGERQVYQPDYYTNGIYTDSVNTYLLNATYLKHDLDANNNLDVAMQIRNLNIATFLELRRQTILMEKQNELLAEQNELMGRLVNSTEIKFECKATGYVQQATSWNLDEPEVNASDYHYNVNPADVVQCANLSYFERANYGCPL